MKKFMKLIYIALCFLVTGGHSLIAAELLQKKERQVVSGDEFSRLMEKVEEQRRLGAFQVAIQTITEPRVKTQDERIAVSDKANQLVNEMAAAHAKEFASVYGVFSAFGTNTLSRGEFLELVIERNLKKYNIKSYESMLLDTNKIGIVVQFDVFEWLKGGNLRDAKNGYLFHNLIRFSSVCRNVALVAIRDVPGQKGVGIEAVERGTVDEVLKARIERLEKLLSGDQEDLGVAMESAALKLHYDYCKGVQ